MPLEAGCSEDVISRNIAELIRSGRDKDQAAAIAYENCRRGKSYIAPAAFSVNSPLADDAGYVVWKGEDGRRLMFLVTSNAYWDREDEAIATKALARYVDSSWAVEDKCITRNKFLFWHDKNAYIGDVAWCDTEGPFLLEVAKERRNAPVRIVTGNHIWNTSVSALWDALETKQFRWGASHGFEHSEGALKHGVYNHIRKFETSVLPLDAAANPYTLAVRIDPMNKDSVLDELTKIPGFAAKFRKGVRAVKVELDSQGLEHKALEAKGLMEDVRALVEKVAGKFRDGVTPEEVDAATQMLVNGLMAMAPAEEAPAEEPAMDDMGGDTMGMSEEEPMMAKGAKLFDELIVSQKALVDDQNTIRDALKSIVKVIEPLSAVAEQVKALETRLEKTEKALKDAPRRASTDPATVLKTDDKTLENSAKKQLERTKELFPGSGIMIRDDSNGKDG